MGMGHIELLRTQLMAASKVVGTMSPSILLL
jgi:hypothetical protein